MSTMLIDQDTFSNLAKALAGIDYTGNGQKYQMVGYNLISKANQFGFAWMQDYVNPNKNNREYDGLNRFFGYLKVLNHRAYTSRYSHHTDLPKYIPYRKEKTLTTERYTVFQVIKSLECIRYNIDAENKALNQIIDLVKNALIEELAEYKKATWG